MYKISLVLRLCYYSLRDVVLSTREILDSIVEHYTPEIVDYSDKGRLNLFDSALLVILIGAKKMTQLARRGLVGYRRGVIKFVKAYVAYAKRKKQEKKLRRSS